MSLEQPQTSSWPLQRPPEPSWPTSRGFGEVPAGASAWDTLLPGKVDTGWTSSHQNLPFHPGQQQSGWGAWREGSRARQESSGSCGSNGEASGSGSSLGAPCDSLGAPCEDSEGPDLLDCLIQESREEEWKVNGCEDWVGGMVDGWGDKPGLVEGWGEKPRSW